MPTSNVVSNLSIRSNIGKKDTKEVDEKKQIIAYRRNYPKSNLPTYI